MVTYFGFPSVISDAAEMAAVLGNKIVNERGVPQRSEIEILVYCGQAVEQSVDENRPVLICHCDFVTIYLARGVADSRYVEVVIEMTDLLGIRLFSPVQIAKSSAASQARRHSRGNTFPSHGQRLRFAVMAIHQGAIPASRRHPPDRCSWRCLYFVHWPTR